MAKVIVISAIAIILLGGGSFLYFTKMTKTNPLTSPNPIQNITPTDTPIVSLIPTSSPSAQTIPNGAKKYTSDKLGVSFYYLETQSGNVKFKTEETGNKIYVYQQNMQPDTGQFVEVFTKNKNDTLKDAIKKMFLTNISEKDCFVTLDTNNKGYTASFETAIIDYAVPTNTGDKPFWSYGEKCPQNYRKTNGIRYFLEDTNNPEKFVFFSIGQYGIGASLDNKELLWQHTIEFLK